MRRHRIPFRFVPIPSIFCEDWLAGADCPLSLNDVKCYLFVCKQLYGLFTPKPIIAVCQFEEYTGLSRRTVQRSLATLVRLHLIRVTGPIKRPRKYELLMPRAFEIGSATLAGATE